MDRDSATPTRGSPIAGLHPEKYQSSLVAASGLKLVEGYSDNAKSMAEDDGVYDTENMVALPSWLLAHSEADRSELAYSLLRTLRTSTISAVVDRLSPLLHMDPVAKLPPEITAEIFFYLDTSSLLTASLASRTWRSRILDSRLWRHLYIREGWRFDLAYVRRFEQHAEQEVSARRRSSAKHSSVESAQSQLLKQRTPPGRPVSRKSSSADPAANVHMNRHGDGLGFCTMDLEHQATAEDDYEMVDPNYEDHIMRSPSTPYRPSMTPESPHVRQTRKLSLTTASPSPVLPGGRPIEQRNWITPTVLTKSRDGLPKLNWAFLYKQRQRLEDNWRRGRFTTFQLPHPLHPEEGHRECVYAIQFSGKWLVSGSRDRKVRVWNLETGRLRGSPLVGHTKSVLCLQFDPSEDEDIIVSGSSDQNVLVWRFSTGQKIQELIGAHDDSVLNLRFDRRYLVTCSKDKLIKVWCRQELRPTDHDYPEVYKGSGVRYPSYIVDTSNVPSAVLEKQIADRQVRTLPPYSLLMTLDGHGAAVNAVQIGEDEIISASGDRLIKVWGIRSGRCQRTLVGHSKGIACVQVADQRIVSGSNDKTVRIYDYEGAAEVACLRGHQDLVRTVQAGFGDLPGADEAMKLEAMAVDNEYFEARRRGEVDAEPAGRRRPSRVDNTGSKEPQDISAVGAKIPPGGGGGKWARIVSGSYDETIIIWRRNHEGKWIPAHRLRQEDAAHASAGTANIPHAGSRSRIPDQTHAAAAAQSGTSQQAYPNGSAPATHQGHTQSNALPQNPALTTFLATENTHDQSAAQNHPHTSGAGQEQTQQLHGHDFAQPLNIPPAPAAAVNGAAAPQAPGAQANANPTAAAGGATNLPLATNFYQAYHAFLHPGHPTARIFKVQFDARKLICASQDYRIVGWDFACGDSAIEEASPFFAGL